VYKLGHVLRQQAEHLRMVGFAQQVHLALGVRLQFGQSGLELGAYAAPVGQHVEQARVEQFVEQDGMALQVGGGPARTADQFRYLAQRLRILLQQRQVGGPARNRLQQFEAAHQRVVRIPHLGRGLDQLRYEGVEAFADAGGELLVARPFAQRRDPLRRVARLAVA
jgi:hypothetical protein